MVDISTRLWTNGKSLWSKPHANISRAIWCILHPPSCLLSGLRSAGIENWVKYAILCVRMSLYLCLCASENQALRARGNIQFLGLAVKLAACFVALNLLGSIKWQVNHSLDSSCKTLVINTSVNSTCAQFYGAGRRWNWLMHNFDSIQGNYFN